MSRCKIRALKWPFERKELEKDLGVRSVNLDTVMDLILNLDRELPTLKQKNKAVIELPVCAPHLLWLPRFKFPV